MIGIHHGPRDWILTPDNTHNAIEALEDKVKISRKWDVPDLAGYDRNGKDFYIDKDCPETIEWQGKEVEIDCYLVLHEAIEIALLKMFPWLNYMDAHQVALCGEKEACETVYGMGFWNVYNTFMRKQIDKAWNKKSPKVPPNLYKKPYVDEREYKKLKQMGYIKEKSENETYS